MIKVCSGITRTVFLVGRYAVKVPSFRGGSIGGLRGRMQSFAWGFLANLSEYEWSKFEGWRGKVAPVLHSWAGGLVQVYPRCEPIPDTTAQAWEAAGCPPLLAMFPDPGDDKPDNYGLLDGRLVRIDYELR